MISTSRRRLAMLSEQLVAPSMVDDSSVDDMLPLEEVAGDSTGPRVKGKVIIVTGELDIAQANSTDTR
jgi:hypothetical protein